MREHDIAYALRWGVALVGDFPYWAWLTLYRKTFQVKGRHWWMMLIRGRICEESRNVALRDLFVNFLNKLDFTCNILYIRRVVNRTLVN